MPATKDRENRREAEHHANDKTSAHNLPSKPSASYYQLLNDSTKFTVITVFMLYVAGFLVWHSYLASYGLSSISFLQAEYVSAAICYLIVFGGFAVPPALLVRHFLYRKSEGTEWTAIHRLFLLWLLAAYYLIGVFFPEAQRSKIPLEIILYGFAAIIICRIIMIALRKWFGNTAAFRKIWEIDLIDIVVAACFGVSILLNDQVDKGYVVLSIVNSLFVLLVIELEKRKNLPFLARMLFRFLVIIFLLGNVQYFGLRQFSHIPKQLGGGKPEMAYLKFATLEKDLPILLNIPLSDDSTNRNGFYGPVAVLLRSDKEIIFLDYKELNHPELITNYVTVETTNYLSNLSTNELSRTVTNIISPIHTNVTVSVSRYKPKLVAKQIQANLVDSIIFDK